MLLSKVLSANCYLEYLIIENTLNFAFCWMFFSQKNTSCIITFAERATVMSEHGV